MSRVHFLYLEVFYLIWVVPAVVLLLVLAQRLRRRALERFARFARVPGEDPARRRLKGTLAVLALVLIVVAGAGIGVDPHTMKVPQRGREVAFLVDVSRSMLARDLAPNRLERTKAEILGAVPSLQGDRVALVAFAGSASVICPLTFDYTFFSESVRRLSTTSASVGGTMIGDAIRYTLRRVFRRRDHAHRDIILISDGGDQGSFPVRAASEAGAAGVRILAIGLGNERAGSRIPIGSGASLHFLTYKKGVVRTRLDASLLRRIATATPGGRYLNVATGIFDLASIYRAFVSDAPKSDLGARRVTRYDQLFQFFLFGAFLLLGAEFLVAERRVKELRR